MLVTVGHVDKGLINFQAKKIRFYLKENTHPLGICHQNPLSTEIRVWASEVLYTHRASQGRKASQCSPPKTGTLHGSCINTFRD